MKAGRKSASNKNLALSFVLFAHGTATRGLGCTATPPRTDEQNLDLLHLPMPTRYGKGCQKHREPLKVHFTQEFLSKIMPL